VDKIALHVELSKISLLARIKDLPIPQVEVEK
jgi:hypothetical protein